MLLLLSTSERRGEILDKLIARKFGKTTLNELPESERNALNLFIRIGCGGHKDLNAFKYGVAEMKETWDEEDRPAPVDLPNKGLDSAMKVAKTNKDTSKLFYSWTQIMELKFFD